jgi:hypothetical protein
LQITTHDCWERNIQSNQQVMQWNITIFHLQYGSGILQSSLCPYVKLKWNYNPVGFCQGGLSIYGKVVTSHCSTYVYLCGQIYASCPLQFKQSSNRVETELKCNTGFREHIPLAFYHIQAAGL